MDKLTQSDFEKLAKGITAAGTAYFILYGLYKDIRSRY